MLALDRLRSLAAELRRVVNTRHETEVAELMPLLTPAHALSRARPTPSARWQKDRKTQISFTTELVNRLMLSRSALGLMWLVERFEQEVT